MREVFKQLLTKKNLIGCEIGVQNGENAQELLNNLSINTIYLVDQWKAYTEVNQEEKDMGYTNQKIVNRWKYSTINRFDKNKQVVIIIGNSDKTSYLFNTEILDFVYIDANHRFKNVYEDLVNCAYREVEEETGLTKDNIKIIDDYAIATTNDIFKAEGKHYTTLFLRAKYLSGKAKRMERDKCSELEWRSFYELARTPESSLFLSVAFMFATVFDTPTGSARPEQPARPT